MFVWALVTLSLVLGCSASKPGCCMPNKFEALEFIEIAESHHHHEAADLNDDHHGGSSLTDIMLHVSVDGTRKMTNSNGTSYSHGKATNWRVIQDFGQMKEYLLNADGTRCKVVPLRQNWTAPCVPEGSKKVLSTYVGLPSNKFPVDMYQIKTPRELEEQMGCRELKVYLQVSSDGCSFISESMKGRTKEASFLVNIGIYDTSDGIKDPSVFDIPAACNHTLMEDPVFRYKSAFLP